MIINNKLLNDLAPVKDDNKSTWLKSTKKTKKIKKIWEDGYDVGDVTKTILNVGDTILSSTTDALTNIEKGFMSTVEGTVDAGRYFLGDAMKKSANLQADIWNKLGNKSYADSLRKSGQRLFDFEKKNAKVDVTGALLGETNDIFKENWSKKVDEKSIFAEKSDSVAQGVGNVGAFAGMANIAPVLGGNEIGTVGSFLNSFSSSYGNSRTEAYKNGADDETANKAGLINGFAEAISEQFFDGMPGMKSAGWGDKLVGKIGESVSKYFNGNVGKNVMKILDASGEGFEEIISNALVATGNNIAHYFDKNYTYGMENQSGNVIKDISSSITSQESWDAFISAMLTSAITNGGAKVINQTQNNHIIKEYAKENNMTVDEVKTQFNDIANRTLNQEVIDNYKDKVELEEQIKKNLASNIKDDIKSGQNKINLSEIQQGLMSRENYIKAVGHKTTDANGKQVYTTSSEGLNLIESYRAYGGDEGKLTEINNIQNFMNKRNLEARFDATKFDSEKQNAIWQTKDGKTSVIFNPNASQDQIIEEIATHEMTHDILSQKTDSGNNLFKDVLDYAKTAENYKEMREVLENTYSKYYDRTSNDFSEKIDEEIVANTLGKQLGTQEYIDRIVNNNPNIAQKIYRWVINKLQKSNIIKDNDEITGFKSEKLYWEGVKNKFEKAYNERKAGSFDDNTKYSIVGYEGINNLPNSPLKDVMTEKYQKAKEMLKNNESNDSIFKETKFYVGTDGKLKTEISDEMFDLKIKDNIKSGQVYKMEDFIDDDYLFAFYPELKDYEIKITDYDDGFMINTIKYVINGFRKSNPNGSYDSTTKTVFLNENRNTEKALKQTLIHEIQHAIQDIEGFENGFPSLFSKEKYIKSNGENEAKLTSKRLEYDKEDRKADPFYAIQEKQTKDRLATYYKNRKIIDKFKDKLYNYLERKISHENPEKDNFKIQTEKRGIKDSASKSRLSRYEYLKDISEEFKYSLNSKKELDNSSFNLQKNNNSIEQQNQLIRKMYPNYKPGITYINSDLVANNIDVIDYETNYNKMSNEQLGISDKEKSYYNEKYKYNLDLFISVDDGKTYFEDSIKGLNLYHAIERAKRNYPAATNIKIKDKSIQLKKYDDIRYSLNLNKKPESGSFSLEQRVSGDELLDAQDLIEEIKSVGANVDKNGYVTLYHQTTKENADRIKQSGKMIANETYVYFSTSKDASQSNGRGNTKLEFKIPAEKLILDDIFSDNADVKIKLDSGKELNISNYIVNNLSISNNKLKQLEIIKNNNPVNDDYHTWIRNIEDIKTLEEAINDNDWKDYDEYNPDLTRQDLEKAIETKKITVYSSYPIEQGTFVSPSKMEAESYSGNGQIYSKEVNINDVAWIDPTQGQYAEIKFNNNIVSEKSITDNQGRKLTNSQQEYFKNSKIRDRSGNLKVMYHGSPNEFTVYDRSKSKSSGEFGKGLYFTSDENIAKGDYSKNGKVYEVYLNAVNPLIDGGERTLTKREIKKLVTEIANNEDYGIENYGYNATVDSVTDMLDKYSSDFRILNDLNLSTVGNFTELVEFANDVIGTTYDAIENYRQAVVFNPNQIKNVDNINPTFNDDIRYSLSNKNNNDVAPVKGTKTRIGELFNNEISPIKEEIKNVSEKLDNLSSQISNIQNQAQNNTINDDIVPVKKETESKNEETQNEDNTTIENNKPSAYIETPKNLNFDRQKYTPLTENDSNLLTDALMNDKNYIKSLSDEDSNHYDNEKLVNNLSKNVSSNLGLGKNQREELKNIIKETIDYDYTIDELADILGKKFTRVENKILNEEAREIKSLIRTIPIKVSDGIKMDIPDYNDFSRRNFGKIRFTRDGVSVDVAYKSLNEKLPNYFPDNIVNPSDQLLKIAEVANIANEVVESVEIPREEIDNIADYITDSIIQDKYNSNLEKNYALLKNIQFDFVDDILPTTIRTQESIDNYIDSRDITPLRKEAKKQELKEQKEKMSRILKEAFINKNYIIDQTALATGNKEITFAADMLNNVVGEVQYNINGKQTDINGNTIGKGIKEIFAPAKKAGMYDIFNDYLIQKSNIERHAIGKGSRVPLEISKQIVNAYESKYTVLKEWTKDVYKYFDNILLEQYKSGIVSKDQYENFRGENGIYRSYVPFYENTVEESKYYDEEGNVKPFSTLLKAKGNAQDTSGLLSVEDAMVKQTYKYKSAIRANELYKEIVPYLGKYESELPADSRKNPTELDSLFTDVDGTKVLSAYVDGKKMSAQISEELYNELSNTYENKIKELEKDFSIITNPIQKISNIRRNLITTWNPIFLVRNAIKDIQDAPINSKHTKDMLKTYFGVGEKAAIKELKAAKTKEAQQFLALYGSENTYGDYSELDSKSKNVVSKFGKKLVELNELIELAPRYAEFKASLKNGDSLQEAIYNAREVTTNFGRGGYITKALNRNGFTFLNASVQGLDKAIRNITGQNGAKGVTSIILKGALLSVAPAIINELLFGVGDDKDEEYEALPNYIKDNYYLIKVGNNFIRIPKGRINSVFGSLARRTIEGIEGEESPFKGYLDNSWSQIGVGDPSSNNILAPIKQVKENKAWHGGDIVPTRLQNKPASEQTDAKIDSISNFIGNTFNVSPYKVNYLLDQYSGGIGDVLLPMLSQETKNGADNIFEYLISPLSDSFVVNSTDDNKYPGNFFEKKEELQIQSNSDYATDEDILKYKYFSDVSKELSDLYKERREVQSDTTITQKEKYLKVQKIQKEINSISKNGLTNYNSVNITGNYARIDDKEYYKDTQNEWKKVNDSDSEFIAGMRSNEKSSYFIAKNEISKITKNYKEQIEKQENTSKEVQEQLKREKQKNITNVIINSNLENYSKAMLYAKYYSSEKVMNNVYNAGYDIDTYIDALYNISEIQEKYSKENGYKAATRKKVIYSYINSLNMNIPQKAMLIKKYYSSFKTYNKQIVDYISELDISYEEKMNLIEQNKMKIKNGRVYW